MPLITVKNLQKSYRVHEKEPGLTGTVRSLFHRKFHEVHAVSDISFSIEPGELIGFIGPNGAGKTTTLKCLSGLLHPTSGAIEVLGHTPFERKPEFLSQIALVMGQKNQLWWDLPPMETFLLNKEIYGISDDHFKSNLDDLTKLMKVVDLVNIPVRKLSLGERMKCELIAALLHSPKVLFLDEPTIGLDVVMQKAMRDFIASYNQKYKATIILTSHYMQDVKELCKRVIIIDKGKLLYDGELSEIVKKYASHKLLTVTFGEFTDVRQLEGIGEIQSFNYPQAIIRVPREKTGETAAKLLKKFSIEDLSIEEINIEDIIRKVFSKSTNKQSTNHLIT